MNCPACQHENREGAKFCEECASPLKRTCTGCGSPLRPGAKFCDECGAPAAAATRPVPGAAPARDSPRSADEADGARKVVSIVFADLVGSTALHERLDAESARRFVEGYYVAMRGAVESQGGTIAKLLGDGVMAVFGLPRVAEDDALRAVRAAVEMQRAFRELAELHGAVIGTTGLRVAVNSGEVVAKEAGEVLGDPVNVAARLQDQARDGDVVIGEATRRLVSALVTLVPLGSLTLKGRAEAVNAYRVVSLDPPASATTSAFVGRKDELARLAAVFDEAVSANAARLAVLLGSPGLGKSRLIAEFSRRVEENATVLTAHCDAAGGASFAPVARALRTLLGIDDGATGDPLRSAVEAAVAGDDADRSRVLDGITALLSASPSPPEETFFVVRRLLAMLAASRPVVLVIDDLHWAEPLLLDLVEHLVQWGAGLPLFVLVGARPELRDARSSLATSGGVVSDVLTLGGLDAGAAMRLAANAIGAADLPAAVAARVLASSEGNPLFVGELVRMLVHEGALKQEGERWTAGAELAVLEMPPTIHALLAARIERLKPEDRVVLERASVVGRHFSRSAVAALLPDTAAELDARLESLRRSELIEPDTGWFLGEPALRFHHVLIRDAAYRRLLKGTRADLHGRFADWVERRSPGAVEHDETVGRHLEQSFQLLRELGPVGASGRALGERAAGRLAAAGRRSLARDDLSLAAGLLDRALHCLDHDDPARAELVLDWCEALLAAGDVAAATLAITELSRFLADSPRLQAWATCFSGQLTALTAPQALLETVDAVAAAADQLARLGDDAGEAKAHSVHAQALARLGRVGACEAALDRALAAARRAGDRRRANAVLAGAPLAALWGPSPVTRASGRCLDVVRVLRITQGAPAVEAVALSCQAVLEALRGRAEAARSMITLSRRMVEELGLSHRLLEADAFAGRIELLQGDAATAEGLLRSAYEGLRDLGLGIDAARAAALLARALLELDRADEAETLSHESERLAGDDLQSAIAWRGVRAEALARRGELDAAVELARASVAIAAATDALLDHADARLALAAALRAAGRSDEADAEQKRATGLWETKGATLLLARARGAARGADDDAPVPGPAATTMLRRVSANAATLYYDRFAKALLRGELDDVAEHLADDLLVVHHPTASSYGKETMLGTFRRFTDIRHLEIRVEVVATIGDGLCLLRQWTRGEESVGYRQSISYGPFEVEWLVLVEVDARGRRRHSEMFADHQLALAITRLYERRGELLVEGPEKRRAEATARSIGVLLGAVEDLETRANRLAEDLEWIDHRLAGEGRRHGRMAFLELVLVMDQLATDLVWRIDDVRHLDEDGVVMRATNLGIDRQSGGAFERPVLLAWTFGDDGLVNRWITLEPEDEARALAVFDEFAEGRASVSGETRFANAASRAMDRFIRCWEARDWEGVHSTYHPDHRMDDRRRLFRLEVAGDGFFVNERFLFDETDSRWQAELLATRDDALALFRVKAVAERSGSGPMEVEMLDLVEVDASGRRTALVVFDVTDVDAAFDEMDRRYDARLAELGAERERWARDFRRCYEARDWAGLAALATDDLVAEDHRLVSWGTLHGGPAWAKSQETLVDLAADTRARAHHVRTCPRGAISQVLWSGTHDGGPFEIEIVSVGLFNDAGRLARMDLYDLRQIDQAFARFHELAPKGAPALVAARPAPVEAATAIVRSDPDNLDDAHAELDARFAPLRRDQLPEASTPPPQPRRRELRANRATDLTARYDAAFADGDLAAIEALFEPSFRELDHPTGTTYGYEGAVASLRGLLRSRNPRLTYTSLATLGECLSLSRRTLSAEGTAGRRFDVGEYANESITVLLTDERGLGLYQEVFPSVHLGDAIARLYALYAEGLPEGPERERASLTARAIANSMTAAFVPDAASLFAPDFLAVDHRPLVGFEAVEFEALRQGDAAWRESTESMHFRVDDVLALRRDATFRVTTTMGTLRGGGGTVEKTAYALTFFGADGRCTRHEVFDLSQQHEAWTRFRELCEESNAATAAPEH